MLPDDWEECFVWRAILDMAAAGDLDLRHPRMTNANGICVVPSYVTPEPGAGPAMSASSSADSGAAAGPSNIRANFYVSTPASQRWYLVTRGRRVGVFQGNHIAQPLTEKVSGAVWHRVASEHEGAQQFTEALIAGAVAIADDEGGMVVVDAQIFGLGGAPDGDEEDGPGGEEQDGGPGGKEQEGRPSGEE